MDVPGFKTTRRVTARWICRSLIGCAVAIATLAGLARAAEVPRKAAVFNFELIDTSLEGEMRGVQDAETARLALISDYLREYLAKSGKYTIIDIAPAAKDIQEAGYIHTCNGCDADIARSLGADMAITGTVQKVSNLILNVNIYTRDAATGDRTAAMSVDIRGNTDKSWLRGVSYIVRNRLTADPPPE